MNQQLQLFCMAVIGGAMTWAVAASSASPYQVLCKCNAYFEVRPPCLVKCPECGALHFQLPRN